jgi:hypothetical protein
MITGINKWSNKLLSPFITYEIGRYYGLKVEPNGKYIWCRRAKILLPSLLHLPHENKRLYGDLGCFVTFKEFFNASQKNIFLSIMVLPHSLVLLEWCSTMLKSLDRIHLQSFGSSYIINP